MDAPFLEPAGMPHLSPIEDGVVLSWWAAEGEGQALRIAPWSPASGFGEVQEVVRGDDFFVNWADFPSVVEVATGRWVAHWLQRNGEGTYAYGVRTSVSDDGGATWSEPWTPHTDGTPTEHGFVSIWPDAEEEGGWHAVWLDGRSPTQEMTLRSRHVPASGVARAGEEELLDARICDCCQTDVALTARGPVVVYRDRSPEEIRDVYLTRLGDEGWTEGRAVHDDGWEIPGCPVNGPSVDARDERVVVAWFSAGQDRPRVQVAFSDDAGDTFGAPTVVDEGSPLGRVDVVLRADGGADVLWLEEATGEEAATLRLRTISTEGDLSPSWTLAETRRARASGFPQLVPAGDGAYLAAWTEVGDGGATRIRVTHLRPTALP